MKFVASRLSEGNKIFPTEIHCEERGLTVRIPGLFKGESQYFDYQQLSSVGVNTPLIGYSTITFYASGNFISAHGFTKNEVNQIKEAISNGKTSVNQPTSSHKNYQELPEPSERSKMDEYRETREALNYLLSTSEKTKNIKSEINEIKLPSIHEDMKSGVVGKWIKRNGDQVTKGELVAELEWEKATFDYEAEYDGILVTIAIEGERIPVGATICKIISTK